MTERKQGSETLNDLGNQGKMVEHLKELRETQFRKGRPPKPTCKICTKFEHQVIQLTSAETGVSRREFIKKQVRQELTNNYPGWVPWRMSQAWYQESR